MDPIASVEMDSLRDKVADQVRQCTYDRVRNLAVEVKKGKVEVSGEVRTWHSKQLAIQAALELLSGDRFRERITVVRPDCIHR